MKQIFLFICLLAATLTQAQTERIVSFHSDILVDTITTIKVKETIKVYAGGDVIRRGITRALPVERNIKDKKERVEYDIVSVKRDGENEPHHTETSSGYMTIYLGSSDTYLSPGEYTYEIVYTATNQIGFFTDYDELYWNVNGTQTSFSTDEVSATVTLPAQARVLQQSCYTGSYSSTEQNCTFNKLSENTFNWQTSGLNPGEGLTIAVGFTKGVIAQPPPPPPPSFFERFGLLIITLLAFIALGAYYYFTWMKYGVDPPKPTVYPQFNIPQDLSPASVGMIHYEYFSTRFITASLVNLAVKGYIHISQNQTKTLGIFTSTNFLLKKIKEADDSLPHEEKRLLNVLFTTGDTVSIDGKYNSKIESVVNTYTMDVKYKHKKLLNEGNNTKMLILPSVIISLVYILCLAFTSYFADWASKPFIWIAGFISLFISIAICVLLSYILNLFSWFKWVFLALSVFVIIVFMAIVVLDNNFAEHGNYYISAGFLIFSFIGVCAYQYFVRRPSEDKLHIKSLIEGFEMYMGTAEERQLQYFNPPEMTPQVFEKLLPYAMVLNVDKIWGKKFEDVLKRMSMNQQYTTTWYNGTSFTPMLLGNALGSSLTNSMTSASTQPSSSGSGSGGGGFSGGGGGGGGVGGW